MQFTKQDGLSVSRISSYRNRSWTVPSFLNLDQTTEFVNDLLINFTTEATFDLEEQLQNETGWVFSRIMFCSAKILESAFNNVVALGKRRVIRPFKQALKPIFLYNVRDTASILPENEGLCVPAAIIMKFLQLSNVSLPRVGKAQIERYLRLLNYQQYLGFTHSGIRIADFHLLEKSNSFNGNVPLLLSFPFLRGYKGFALNLFRIIHHKNLKVYTIHPRHLSAHFKDPAYLQIDLLLDGDNIRDEPYCTDSYSHVMLILDLVRLSSGFRCPSGSRNERKNWSICRQCLSLFQDIALYKLHIASCAAFGAGNVKRRISRNVLVHKTEIFLKKKNRKVPHYLSFNLKDLYKCKRPLSFFTMDYESGNLPVKDCSYKPFSTVPTSAVFEQRVLGGSYTIKNVFPNFPLPSSLSSPRCLFRTEIQSEKQFYLSFFTKLRTDIKLLHRYEQEIFDQSPPTPHLSQLSITEKIRYLSTQFCDICHAKFGGYRTLLNGKRCKLIRNIDHCHVVYKASIDEPDSPTLLNKVICQFCNLNLTQSCDSPKITRIIYLHNAER